MDEARGGQFTRKREKVINSQGNGKIFSGGFALSGIKQATEISCRPLCIEQLLQKVRFSHCATLTFVHRPCFDTAADLVVACQWRLASPEPHFRL
jgi:enoyl-CoA hydratase/carnithine racemase